MSRLRLSALLVTLAALSPGLPPCAAERELTFDQRVEAQRAIERVYYSHQTDARLPFDSAVPPELLEHKLRDYLRQSAALEQRWALPITDAMLRVEAQRIAQSSRMPERLTELYGALGNDPVLILECLVRPVLAGRLARARFASDAELQAGARQEAAALRTRVLEGKLSPSGEHPLRQVVHSSSDGAAMEAKQIGGLVETSGSFEFRVRLDQPSGSDRVAVYAIPKKPWDDWWQHAGPAFDTTPVHAVASSGGLPRPLSPTCSNSWDRSGAMAPTDNRAGHTAVWTGNRMLVWGGRADNGILLNTGLQYDPVTDTSVPMRTIRAPSAREGHSAVWTGSRMVIWGATDSCFNGGTGSGGSYNPITDSWSIMSTFSGPSCRTGQSAVWTGTHMLIWGGEIPYGYESTGYRYDPQADVWTAMATTQAPSARAWHSAIWSGNLMVVWGGRDADGSLLTGGRYDPQTDAWSPTSVLGSASARFGHTAVWTADRMIVWGGADGQAPTDSGALYNPADDTWTPTSLINPPSARSGHTAVAGSGGMIVWGGQDFSGRQLESGGRYDPGTNSWSATSLTGVPVGRTNHSAVWTGSQMIIWAGLVYGDGNASGRYDPATDTWLTSPYVGQPTNARAVWTGSLMIVGSGTFGPNALFPPLERYDPVLDLWTPASHVNAPACIGDGSGPAVWTGQEVIVSGGRYDPIADIWRGMSTTDAPPAGPIALWTGSEMILWGGGGSVGGRYRPDTDTWVPVSVTGAPPDRPEYVGVWTGSRMIVWGSGSASLPVWDSAAGGQYDPASDTWFPMSTTNMPSARSGVQAVWAGGRMVVLGGYNGSCNSPPSPPGPCTWSREYSLPGGSYDPVSDSWTTLPTAYREQMSLLSSGDEALYWGGKICEDLYNCFFSSHFNNGFRVNPQTGAVPALNRVDAPSQRANSAAVWTGQEMIIWGGSVDDAVYLRDGGRYTLAPGDPDNDGDGFNITCDCDDTRSSVWPGAPEICDGMNNDCDSPSWPDVSSVEVDQDGDNQRVCSGDCDENHASVYSGAPQICGDGLNNDCLLFGWPSLAGTNEFDDDDDGFSECQGDCLDYWASIHPGAAETCDGRDNDCDGLIDEGSDLDGDLWGQCAGDCDDNNPAVFPGAPQICDGVNNNCSAPGWPSLAGTNERDDDFDSFSECQGDCNDHNRLIYPGAPELCDHVDNDCDGAVDEEILDLDGDTFTPCTGDCNENNAAVFPGAPQICDGVNNNCSAPGWPSLAGTNERDDDFDTFSECQGDCNDANRAAYPGALEICDQVDNDCDGAIDEEFLDLDGDSFSPCTGDCDEHNAAVFPGAPQVCDGVNNNCAAPGWPSLSGTNERDDDLDTFSECQGDCNDANQAAHPGLPEVCDGTDNDCDSVIDEGFNLDGDFYAPCTGDCDEGNAAIYPGAPQVCDGLNNNCSAPGWPSLAGTNESDDDADGYSECQNDCADADPTISPGAPDVCDLVDNNCDGQMEESADTDGDLQSACNGDCDPTNPAIYTGAPQVCDGVNNDCATYNWPALAFTNEADDDRDGLSECQSDCDDGDGSAWQTPGEPSNLVLTYDAAAGLTSLSWQAPAQPGGLIVYYDVLRTRNKSNFVSPTGCVEINDSGDTAAVDFTLPQAGTGFFFLVRSENGCPGGARAGSDSTGAPIPARSCP